MTAIIIKAPIAAQTEAVMAGALQVQLAGDAWYFGELYKKPTIGDPIRPVRREDIRAACRLEYGAVILQIFGDGSDKSSFEFF